MRLFRRILVSVAVALLLQRALALPVAAAPIPADIVGTFAIASWPQCTWLVWSARTDLRAVTFGPAGDWGWEAAQAGYGVTSVPVVGSVAVFRPFVQGAWDLGHVALVVAVGSGSWFQVRELNWWPFPTVTHYRWAHVGPGVRFIDWRR